MSDHDHDHEHDHEHADAGAGGDAAAQEALIREMALRLARTPVRDMLIQTMATFADLAGVRLGYGPEGREHRDLQQARLAIETLRALIAVGEEHIGAAQAKPFREPLAQLQMLYAREVEAETAGSAPDDAGAEGGQPDSGLWTPEDSGSGDAKIWTPGSDA